MAQRLAFLIGLALALVLTGCGGGGGSNGGGGDDDDGMDAGTPLIGFWQPIEATEAATVRPMATALKWPTNITNVTYEFRQNGTVVARMYTGASLTRTVNGTWFTDMGAGQMVLDGTTYPISNSTNWANVASMTLSHGGHTYTVRMAAIKTLTEHNSAVAKTWKAASVAVDGVVAPVGTFFGFAPGSDAATLQLLANGTAIGRELDEDEVASRGTGTWATGGDTALGNVSGPIPWVGRSIYSPGAMLTITLLVPTTGQSVKISLEQWAPGGTRAPALVGRWRPTGVTRDGSPMSLADFFEYGPGVTQVELEFWADGSREERQYAGSTYQSAMVGWWSTSGASLTLDDPSPDPPLIANYNISGSTMTVSFTMDSHNYVVTLSRL